MGNTDQLFDSLFKRKLLANDNKDFLTGLTKKHPYFTAAQFYLLQLTEADTTSYNKQAAKTAILFNNPLWLNYQLNQSVASSILQQQIYEKEAGDDKGIYYNEMDELEKVHPLTDRIETIFDNEKLIISSITVEEDAAVVNEIVPEAQDTFTGSLLGTVVLTEEQIKEPENKDEDYDYDGDDITEEGEIEPMNIKLDFTIVASTAEDTLTYEPLHRSDYFASVGIKLSEEIKPGDKLGKQLKSFTDWLKTMKKIHEEQLPPQNEQSDIIIQKMAEKSNTEGEVLTETMADVLLQQGKSAKAIELYQKLSLLNPAKSIYFASKIGQIKR